jgi:glutamyl-tRNA synthetase
MNTNDTNKKIVTRFAPSPTGFMHIGGVRTALFAWLWARKNKGEFILRIEDTDKEREVYGSTGHIKESLDWLGLNWDSYFVQSERIQIYHKYADDLVNKGLAYPDTRTEEEIDNLKKKSEEKKELFLYRNDRPEKFEKWDKANPLRFKVPNVKRFEWEDVVWGKLSAGEEALDDFIIIKSDGYPTYNFAHIVDDIEMRVTHVMRGQEFISSTPKFLSLYQALEAKPPEFVTLPPILSSDGKRKLSKRDGAKDILEYRKDGYLPSAIINFLVLLGWNPGDDKEIFFINDLISEFDLHKIQRSGAKLNSEKLEWVNKEHLKLIPIETQINEIKKYFENISDDLIYKLRPIVMDRIHKWSDLEKVKEEEFSYFFKKPNININILYWKGNAIPEKTRADLGWISKTLKESSKEFFESSEKIKSLIFTYATEKGRGEVLWPLRVSLSGREKSPDPFTLIYILGKEETLDRIDHVLKLI